MNYGNHNAPPFNFSDSLANSTTVGKRSPVISELFENKEMIDEILTEKSLAVEKDPRVSKVIDYEIVTGLELFLKHFTAANGSIDTEQCGACAKKFYSNLAKLQFNDILEDLMTSKDNEIIKLGGCTNHFFHANCILKSLNTQTPPALRCSNCISVLFPNQKQEEQKKDEQGASSSNRKGQSPNSNDPNDKNSITISGVTYKIVIDEKSDPLLLQILMNKNYLEELVQKKQVQKKDPRITKISDYHLATALELFIQHHDPKHKALDDEKCSICMCEFIDDTKKLTINDLVEDLTNPKDDEIIRLEKCDGHYFHTGCMLNYISSQASSHIKCPNCTKIYGIMTGTQPPGTMRTTVQNNMHCAGYNDCGTIMIEYHFPSGTLPNGKRYSGTSRRAYLPDNSEGREVLNLLKISFERKLTFTVGTSVTTGMSDTVVWNGVHHKTNLSGGSSHFGYPDATYFDRVKQELAARGVS